MPKFEALRPAYQYVLLFNILQLKSYDLALDIIFPEGTLHQKLTAIRRTRRVYRLFGFALDIVLQSIHDNELTASDVRCTTNYLEKIRPDLLDWIENVTQGTTEKCEGNAIGSEG